MMLFYLFGLTLLNNLSSKCDMLFNQMLWVSIFINGLTWLLDIRLSMRMLKSMIICIISIVTKEKMITLRNSKKIKNRFDLSKFQSVSLDKFLKQFLMNVIQWKIWGINSLLLTERSMLGTKNLLPKR